ncbi:ATP-binding protein [Candidatus Woesearchaeota archaeon]|nr:ATP-binding protein [Candidatus Woesearchaeota archaeon]
MDKETIIEILSEWNFWKGDQDIGIVREQYLTKLDRLVRTEQVVAITGARRSGKSTLMKQFIKRQITAGKDRTSFLYVNFEEPKFAGVLSLDFLQQAYDAYIEIVKPKGMPFILLDEVQNVPRWERLIRGLHERKAAHILISGSTANLLSKEFGTLLTGRWVEMKTYPLTFSEFLRFKGLSMGAKFDVLSQKVKIKQLLREYLEFGGFPLVALKEEKEDLLRRYFDDIIGRDIAERHAIRKVERLKALAKYYLTNFSSPASYRRIAKFIGLSLDSVERFSDYMAEACLVFFVPKFSFSLKEQEINPRVIYCIDPGLVNIVSFRFSDNIGRLYENAVFLSLIIEGGKEIYYHRGRSECDFLIKEGKKITQAIQVSYQLANKEREIGGLVEAMDAFRLKEGLIITEDKEGEERIGGKIIKYAPLWKWLLTRVADN